MKTYRVFFADNRGSRASDVLAGSVGGSWRNSVQKFDGEHDLAFIECPENQQKYIEECMEEDANVIEYEIND